MNKAEINGCVLSICKMSGFNSKCPTLIHLQADIESKYILRMSLTNRNLQGRLQCSSLNCIHYNQLSFNSKCSSFVQLSQRYLPYLSY